MGDDDQERARSILVPIDGSAADGAAVECALRLARVLRAQITLLAVAPLAGLPTPATALAGLGTPTVPARQLDALTEHARDKAAHVAATLPRDVDVATCVGLGAAADAMLDEARTGDYDLVVVAWHGRGAIGRLLRDHPLRRLLEHSPVPVVVTPAVSRRAA
jgi:nucleotide-binding universal stress UspA family protein